MSRKRPSDEPDARFSDAVRVKRRQGRLIVGGGRFRALPPPSSLNLTARRNRSMLPTTYRSG
jgi:hypothetical protein